MAEVFLTRLLASLASLAAPRRAIGLATARKLAERTAGRAAGARSDELAVRAVLNRAFRSDISVRCAETK